MKPRTEKALHESTSKEPQEDGFQEDVEIDETPTDDDSSELDEIDPDDPRWDAFIADDDERDPQPDYGDFWPED
jgi:hypothetical protein